MAQCHLSISKDAAFQHTAIVLLEIRVGSQSTCLEAPLQLDADIIYILTAITFYFLLPFSLMYIYTNHKPYR